MSYIISYVYATYNVFYDKVSNLRSSESNTTNNRIYKDVSYYNMFTVPLLAPSHIIDNIYLGSAHNAGNYKLLKDMKIDIIINITKEISNYYPSEFIYKKYDVNDNDVDDISGYLDDIYNFMKANKNKNILVHCYMGASRSVTAVVYYLVKEKGMTVEKALEYVRGVRVSINPNERFIEAVRKK